MSASSVHALKGLAVVIPENSLKLAKISRDHNGMLKKRYTKQRLSKTKTLIEQGSFIILLPTL